MLFEKTLNVIKEIRLRKNRIKEHIKQQQKELKDLLPFEAKRTQTLKVINMAFEKTPNLKSITIETDPNSEAIVNEYMQNELKDYIVKKHEDNPLLYDITIREIEL